MFKKCLWPVLAFFLGILLAVLFPFLRYMKNRNSEIYVLRNDQDPGNRFSVVSSKHMLDFADFGDMLLCSYSSRQPPKTCFSVLLASKSSPALEITWNLDSYLDYNGDMIFDLKLPIAGKHSAMFSDRGEWKPCKIVSLKKAEILYNGQSYIFNAGRWEKKDSPD